MESPKRGCKTCKKVDSLDKPSVDLTPQEQRFTEGYLSRAVHHLPRVERHMDCRRLEVNQAIEDLNEQRVTWIVSEWDMGGDDFLAVLKSLNSGQDAKVFRLDMAGFDGVDDLVSLRTIWADGDINKLLEHLEFAGESYVILDNISLGQGRAKESEIVNGVKVFVEAIKDFCKDVKVIVRSTRSFAFGGVRPIVLRPLDQAECKIYVDLHANGKNAAEDDISYGDLYGYTRGLPGRIDKLLSQLAYSSFSDIANGSSEQSIDDQADISTDIKVTIERLRREGESGSRVYGLLLALSIFSFGESIKTIKYFNREKPFRVSMLTELIDLGLAEVVEVSEIGQKRGEIKQFVAVKRPVQAYLHKLIGEVELSAYYQSAVGVYFGPEYKLGRYKLCASLKLRDHSLSSLAEQNASLILSRFISDISDVEGVNKKEVIERVMVFHYYVARLERYNKYLYLVKICKAILPKLYGYGDENFVKNIKAKYAESLRMLGHHNESISAFEELLKLKNDVDTVASMIVSCAYSYQSVGDNVRAVSYAQKVKNLKVKGASLYHAESIMILASSAEGKYGKLKRLATKARRDECFVSANNMEFDLIKQCSDPFQRMELYRKIWKQAKNDGDDYNTLRGVANYCELAVDFKQELVENEPALLLEAYRFSYGQRQSEMFRKSHKALWYLFERHDGLENLLILFRHSSILQRLTGKDGREKEYLFKLIKRIGGCESELVGLDDGVKRYFVARALNYNALPAKSVQKLISR